MKEGFDLVLASASPRRRELLERLGLRLRVAPVDLDETPLAGERPGDCVRRLAAAKCDAAVATLTSLLTPCDADARADADEPRPRTTAATTPALVTVLAADTMVSLDGAIFGKPTDAADARAMLARLAGRRHEVTTAYRIWRGPVVPGLRPAGGAGAPAVQVVDRAVTTLVSLRLLQPAEIDAYAANGEWQGKAGGYALQGIAGAFITELRGSHTGVIGLPVAEVLADLAAVDALRDYPRAAFGATPTPTPTPTPTSTPTSTSTSTPKAKTELHQDRFHVGFSGISKSDWDRIFGDSKDSNEKLANARVKTGRKTRR